MGHPTRGSWKRLKKASKYLKGVEKVTWVMKSYDAEMNVDMHVASNWASGPEKRSTSGGMMMINGTVVQEEEETKRMKRQTRKAQESLECSG